MYSSPQPESSREYPYHRPRPWSPDPHHPLAPLSNRGPSQNFLSANIPGALPRRETSESSIEALDLADYARTLHTRPTDDPYSVLQRPGPSHFQDQFPSYPPGSYIPNALDSRDSLSLPSLVSRIPTLSSNATHSTSRASRRPFSLPTPSSSSRALHSSMNHIHQPQPHIATDPQSEIDIAHFPAWSRSWYDSRNPNNRSPPPPINDDHDNDDFYTPIPPSNLGQRKSNNFFDPNYVHHDQDLYYPQTDPSSLSDPRFAPPSSRGHESTRELLPWSLSDGSATVDPLTKEERLRMLEREFGKNNNNSKRKTQGDFLDEDGKPLIGTVDARGNLVTQGPKKRITVRLLQMLFSLGAGIPAIYAAVVIKPNPPAPPAGTPQAYVLYVLSILTYLLLFYLFFIRTICCSPRRKNKTLFDNPLAGGMMVLPVPNTGKKKNKGKKPKKGGRGRGEDGGDVQVNLIVDPNLFSGGPDDDDDDDDSDDEAGSAGQSHLPGGYYGVDGNGARGKGKGKRTRRRGIIAGLAMEKEWKLARAWAKKITLVDVLGLVVWGAVFIFVLLGKKCPSGGFEGWCNDYNVSLACSCLLCVSFGVSLFFDVKDLHTSKASPRTRT